MPRDFTANHIYSIGHRVSRVVAQRLSRLETHGAENLPSGGALIMCNHASYLDPVYLGSGLDREVYYMARSTLFLPGPIDRLLHSVNAFPVHRGRPDRAALKYTLKLAHDGRLVLIFPEGTRSLDGQLGEAAAGASFLAYQAEVPVIPAYLHNMHRVWPRGSARPRRTKVRLYIGPELDLTPARAERGRVAYEMIGSAVMAAIAKLQAEADSSRFDQPPHLLTSRSRLGCPIVRTD